MVLDRNHRSPTEWPWEAPSIAQFEVDVMGRAKEECGCVRGPCRFPTRMLHDLLYRFYGKGKNQSRLDTICVQHT
jgi:hypothetical protein